MSITDTSVLPLEVFYTSLWDSNRQLRHIIIVVSGILFVQINMRSGRWLPYISYRQFDLHCVHKCVVDSFEKKYYEQLYL